MLYMVDTVDVEPARAGDYVEALQTEMAPIYERAGATFEQCLSTRGDIGQPVSVLVTWSVPDVAAWNVVRKNLVLDAEWYACAERLRSIRIGGKRRFYEEIAPRGFETA